LANRDSLTAEEKKEFIINIKKELRVKYLRTMPDGGDLAQFVSVAVIPAKEYNKSANIQLEGGDVYSLQITNNSSQNLYYTVLDIYPDNTIDILYPYKAKEPADYIVEKNNTVIRKLKVSKDSPPGLEILKVIVSKEPMDMRGVFEQKSTRANMKSFETVLDDLFTENQGVSTRAQVSNIKAEEIGIVSASFIINKN